MRTYKAYLNLQQQNGYKWTALKRGEQLFGFGIFMVLVALILYLVSSEPPKMAMAKNNGNSTTQPAAISSSSGNASPVP